MDYEDWHKKKIEGMGNKPENSYEWNATLQMDAIWENLNSRPSMKRSQYQVITSDSIPGIAFRVAFTDYPLRHRRSRPVTVEICYHTENSNPSVALRLDAYLTDKNGDRLMLIEQWFTTDHDKADAIAKEILSYIKGFMLGRSNTLSLLEWSERPTGRYGKRTPIEPRRRFDVDVVAQLAAYVGALWLFCITWTAFFGGQAFWFPYEFSGTNLARGLFWLILVDPIVATIGYWIAMLVLMPLIGITEGLRKLRFWHREERP
jgi:hypothetical protein